MFSGERESLVILTDTHAAPCALTHTHILQYIQAVLVIFKMTQFKRSAVLRLETGLLLRGQDFKISPVLPERPSQLFIFKVAQPS